MSTGLLYHAPTSLSQMHSLSSWF